MSFYIERNIKAVRKDHRCLGCSKVIKKGNEALYCSGHSDGDFWYGHFHADCREAEVKLNRKLKGPYGWCNLRDYADDCEPSEEVWMKEKYPEVYARLFGSRK